VWATAYDDVMLKVMDDQHVLRPRWPRLAILLLLVVAAPASAACVSQWDCTKGSPCERIQTCDNVFETPAIPPSGTLTSPRVSPPPNPTAIPTQVVPPFGRSACTPAYLCSDDGKCSWQTRCK
jgi:hypothetical protein